MNIVGALIIAISIGSVSVVLWLSRGSLLMLPVLSKSKACEYLDCMCPPSPPVHVETADQQEQPPLTFELAHSLFVDGYQQVRAEVIARTDHYIRATSAESKSCLEFMPLTNDRWITDVSQLCVVTYPNERPSCLFVTKGYLLEHVVSHYQELQFKVTYSETLHKAMICWD